MKNSLKYLSLWQKKRSELKIDDDPQSDWLQMVSLLDKHLPVEKKSSRFKGFRLLPTLFVTFSAAAMIYTVSNIYSLEKQGHRIKYRSGKEHHIKSASAIDSLTREDSIAHKESLILSGQRVGRTDSANAETRKTTLIGLPANNTNTRSADIKERGNGSSRIAVAIKPGAGAGTPNSSKPAIITTHPNPRVNGLFTRGNTGAGRGFSSRHGKRSNLMVTGLNANHKPRYPNKGAANRKAIEVSGNIMVNSSQPNNDLLTRPTLIVATPWTRLDPLMNNVKAMAAAKLDYKTIRIPSAGRLPAVKTKKEKIIRLKDSKPSGFDWGLLIGVNSSGSFTPKNQNANFYGSAPVDLYFGLFASFKLNDSWAINPQVKLFNPQTITTTYTHTNQSKVDSGQLLSITSSRKIYSVTVPIYAVYKVSGNISLKAGPVISFPAKQINANSILQPYTIRNDSAYFVHTTSILNATQYQQNINFGLSGGASLQFKRWIFEATYLKSLSGYGLTNGLGTYKSNGGALHFTIGFQLNKVKP